MTQEKVILTPSIHVYSYEMQEALENGFKIDDSNPPCFWGTYYECHMIKKADAEMHDAVFVEPKRPVGRPKQVK